MHGKTVAIMEPLSGIYEATRVKISSLELPYFLRMANGSNKLRIMVPFSIF